MSSEQSLELGLKLEEFTFVKMLGAGGFGITYQAIDGSLQRDVAIKEYFPQQFAERRGDNTILSRPGEDNAQTFQWGLDRFLAEARTLARLDHPNVVKVSRYFEGNGTAYLVMAFEEGKDLEDWLVERKEPLLEEEIMQIVLPLLDGLEAVHEKGLIHRDIKPHNIMIRGNGTPVLIDFGSARSVGREQTSLTTLISPGYSPPEQYSSDPAAQGPWTDVYAMAGVLYRMISGSGPQDALTRITSDQLQSANKVANTKLKPSILNAIDAGLAINVENRPKSIAEFRALLEGKKVPSTQRPASEATTLLNSTQPTVPARSSKRLGLLASAAAVVVVAVVALYIFIPTEPQTVSEPADTQRDIPQVDEVIEQPVVSQTVVASPASVKAVPLYDLSFDITPLDASVSINGQPYTRGMQMPAGQYALVATGSGFQTVTQQVSLPGDQSLQLTLTRTSYPFTVFTKPSNARIRINNIAQTYAPGMTLPAGNYEVNVSAPDHQTWQGTVKHGLAITEQDIELIRLYTLTLDLNPQDTVVDVAGQEYVPGMRLAAGEYMINARKPGYQPFNQTVTLDQDRVTMIELTPSLGVLTLIVTPGDARITLPQLERHYTPGMRLPIGKVLVRISRERYQSSEQEIAIRPGNNAIVINLQRGG